MKRSLATVLALLAITFGAAPPLLAQGFVTIISAPSGAEILLSGEAIITGITPSTFRYSLSGSYRLKVSRPGYETFKSHLLIDPGKEMLVDIRLVPKTRFKALARSFFIPGWGQHYSGSKTKGILITTLAAFSAVGYFVADNDFDKKFDHYVDRFEDFDDAVKKGVGREQLENKLDELKAAQDEAYDAENIRRIAIGSVIGILGINLLDAFFFFPVEHGTVTVKGISLAPIYQQKQVGLVLSARF